MKDIIWLSPSLAAGAIAARLVALFGRHPQMSPRRGVELRAPSRARHTALAGLGTTQHNARPTARRRLHPQLVTSRRLRSLP
jgi:hypothetical protein